MGNQRIFSILSAVAIGFILCGLIFVVADSESIESSDDNYVCKLVSEKYGEKEFSTFADAISEWNDDSKTSYDDYTLWIYGGEYTIDSTIRVEQQYDEDNRIAKSLVIRSDDGEVTIKLGSSLPYLFEIDSIDKNYYGGKVEIKGITFDMTAFTPITKVVEEQSVVFINTYIWPDGSPNVHDVYLTDCHFEGSTTEMCKVIKTCSRSQSKDLMINYCTGNNISYVFEGYCDGINIYNSQFENCQVLSDNSVDRLTNIYNCKVTAGKGGENCDYIIRAKNGGSINVVDCVLEYKGTADKRGIIGTKGATDVGNSAIVVQSTIFIRPTNLTNFHDIYTEYAGKVILTMNLNGTEIGQPIELTTGGTSYYNIPTVTMTLDKNGGEGGSDTAKAYAGTMPFDIETPVKTGFVFDGFYNADGTTKYFDSEGKALKEYYSYNDCTLYAKWIERKSCTISYDSAGAIGPVPSSKSYYTGDYFTVAEPDEGLVKEGYIFDGWSDGYSKYAVGEKYKVVSSIALKAVWVTEVKPIQYDYAGFTVSVTDSSNAPISFATVFVDGIEFGSTDDKGLFVSEVEITQQMHSFTVCAKNNTGNTSEITLGYEIKSEGNVINVKFTDFKVSAYVTVEEESDINAVVDGLIEVAVEQKGASDDVYVVEAVVDNSTARANELSDELAALKAASGNNQCEFLDVTILVKKNMEDPSALTELGDVIIEICVPFDVSGKSNIKILEYHEDSIITFEKDETTHLSGTYYIENGWLHMFSSNFSPFTITYSTDETIVVEESSFPILVCCIIAVLIAMIFAVSSYDYCRGRKN